MRRSGFGVSNMDPISHNKSVVNDHQQRTLWHLDEVFVTINGQRYYLWRAVDSEGVVLDILMEKRRNAQAAKRFFEGVLSKTSSSPRVLIRAHTTVRATNAALQVAPTGAGLFIRFRCGLPLLPSEKASLAI